MSSRQNDSWRNQYHAVEEFELPKETHRMLPPPSSSPTMPDHQQQQQSPPQQQQAPIASSSTSSSSTSTATVQHRNSRSFPSSPLNPQGPQARPSTSSGGSHQNHGTTSSKTLPRSPSSASQPLASLTSTPPVSSPFGSTGRPGSRGSFTFTSPASPASPSTPLGGSLNGRSGLGLSGTQTPTTELLAAHHTFGGSALPTVGSRGSMILYRRADSGLFSPPISGVFDGLSIAGGGGRSGTATPVQVPSHTGGTGMSGMSEDAPSHAGLLPPQLPFSNNRSSVYSTSGESSLYGVERGLVAYAYDPDEDDESDDEEGDWLHDPAVAYPGTSEAKAAAAAIAAASGSKGKGKPLPKPGIDPTTHRKITDPTDPLYIPKPYIAPRISWRGLINIGTLVAMVASLLCLFVVYPMVRFYADDGKNALITGNLRINSTGQAEYINGEEGSEEGGGDGEGEGTPTSTRPPRTTVTSINEGGNIFDRRVVKWKRETDDWAVEFPAPSYNLNFFGGEVKNVEEVPMQVVQVVHVCLPSPTTTIPSEEERKRRLEMYRLAKSGIRVNTGEAKVEVKVEFGVGEEVVEGLYYQGKWAFSKPSELLLFSILDNDDDDEAEEDEEDEEWQLVKKHLPTSPRLSIRLMDSPSSSDTAPVSIRNVLVRSQEGTWSETSGCGAEAAEGDADAVNVSVSVSVERVLEVVGKSS